MFVLIFFVGFFHKFIHLHVFFGWFLVFFSLSCYVFSGVTTWKIEPPSFGYKKWLTTEWLTTWFPSTKQAPKNFGLPTTKPKCWYPNVDSCTKIQELIPPKRGIKSTYLHPNLTPKQRFKNPDVTLHHLCLHRLCLHHLCLNYRSPHGHLGGNPGHAGSLGNKGPVLTITLWFLYRHDDSQ